MQYSFIVGVMGPAQANDDVLKDAYELGAAIASQGWTLLTGGSDQGVMHAASKGASEQNGLVIGVLPGNDKFGSSEYVNVPVITGMGSGRNLINILTSDIIVACGEGPGTASEIALAIKHKKKVILLRPSDQCFAYFKSLDDMIMKYERVEEVIEAIKEHKSESGG